jgi:ribose 5-phosphate isomerase B
MKIAIGSDHAGFLLKETLRQWLLDNGHDVTDVGTYSEERTDYPHYGALVGRAVASGEVDRGVAVCGSGQGICMAANKVPGVRGGVVRDLEDAMIIRHHNDANVACFGERFTTPEIAVGALEAFLATDFDGGRHVHRIGMLTRLDETHGASDV